MIWRIGRASALSATAQQIANMIGLYLVTGQISKASWIFKCETEARWLVSYSSMLIETRQKQAEAAAIALLHSDCTSTTFGRSH